MYYFHISKFNILYDKLLAYSPTAPQLPSHHPPPPTSLPPGGILLIREPYQSPEYAFDSFLKDDLPDQNKNVEKCKQQCEDLKSSSSL